VEPNLPAKNLWQCQNQVILQSIVDRELSKLTSISIWFPDSGTTSTFRNPPNRKTSMRSCTATCCYVAARQELRDKEKATLMRGQLTRWGCLWSPLASWVKASLIKSRVQATRKRGLAESARHLTSLATHSDK
jgi:hypothetical protein